MEEIKNRPNFNLSCEAAQKIMQIPTPIKTALIVISLPNETAGSVLIGSLNLTEQAKINALLQVMAKLNIPFKHLQKYGNLSPSQINMKAK